MPDGMLYKPACMIPLDSDEFADLCDTLAEMLGEAGAIFGESLHRDDIGDAVSEVGQNIRGAQKRSWFPDPDFVEATPPVQDVDMVFGDAAHDPHADEMENDAPALIVHDSPEVL